MQPREVHEQSVDEPMVRASADLVREARARQAISQAQLALRADVPEAIIAAVEAGGQEPDDELLERLLLVMGEEPVRDPSGVVASRRIASDWDPLQLAEERRKTPSERLAGALLWNKRADEIYLAFKHQRERAR
jgi:transcriptional regulator with XRE-family HTH domain